MSLIHSPSNLHLTLPPNHPQTTSAHLLTTTPTTVLSPGHQFHQKIIYLESLSINSIKALTLNPLLRTAPLTTLLTVSQTLTHPPFNLPHSSLGRILDMFPSLLTVLPQTDLIPVSEFLIKESGLPAAHLPRAIIRCPRLLLCSVPHQLRPTLMFLKNRLRFRGVTSHTTVILVSSVQHTLIPKVDFLKGLGFREDVVVNMIQRSPALLTYSVDKNLVPKIEYFLGEMEGDLGEIRSFPQYFSFSLDGRIKVRHRLLEEYGISMSLKDMLTTSDGEFNVRLLEARLR